MALRFRHQGETFLVEGNINSTTVKQFKNHLEFLLLFNKSLTLNMDGVKTIDENGLKVIKELHTASLLCNKKFSIIGKESKGIYADFLPNNAA